MPKGYLKSLVKNELIMPCQTQSTPKRQTTAHRTQDRKQMNRQLNPPSNTDVNLEMYYKTL